jgi:hypothetical protein
MSQVIRGALNKPYELPRNLTDRSDGTQDHLPGCVLLDAVLGLA